MKKVIIIGCPGSGKSTFARSLAEKTGLPLYYLDQMYWNADRSTVEKSVFLQRLQAALDQAAWIIDGNYQSTMEKRIEACDTVVFLDYPTELCLDGIRARCGKPRPDLPWIENKTDAEFETFVSEYRANNRPKVLQLLAKYTDKTVIVLHDRKEADLLLHDMDLL